jgi:hypothetical protein
MRNKYTKELLEPVIALSKSWAEVCRKLNVTPSTGAQTHLTSRAKSFDISTTHFTGQGWAKGKSFEKKPIEFYLKRNSSTKSHSLKLRLIAAGIKEARCEICKLVEWQGEKIPLELHHINEDHNDNRLENLAILCPNCHAQQ